MFKYQEISSYIINGIETGALISGKKIKSLRSLAVQFNCSISVVIQSYQDLEMKGYISPIEKSGYYIVPQNTKPIPNPQNYNHDLKPLSSKTNNYTGQIIDMARNKDILPFGAAMPDSTILVNKKLNNSIIGILKNDPNCTNLYTTAKGSIELRNELVKYMSEKGVFIDSDEIVITNGCAEALYIALKSCNKPNDTVIIETPVFFSLISILEKLELNVIEVPTKSDTGLDLNILDSVIKTEHVKTIVFSPTFQNPLCSVMPVENKKRLYDIADKNNITLIEDDIYGDCSFENIIYSPIKSLDISKRVIYCSSFSKTLSPGLRIGWAIPGRKINEFTDQKQITSLGGSLFTQLAVANYLKSGQFNIHLKKFQKSIFIQTTTLKRLIEQFFPHDIKISNPKGGYFLWVELSDSINSFDIHKIAYKNNIGIVPGPVFSSSDKYLNCIRISCGSIITEEIIEGIKLLGSIIKSYKKKED